MHQQIALDDLTFSVVIPAFNNKEVLNSCFPSVVKLLDCCNVVEIIVVDDNSSDGTGDWIRTQYPLVKLYTNDINIGFGKSCLHGITNAKSEWIILLNSDVKIKHDFIVNLIEDISSTKDLFAVSFFSFNESGERYEGRKMLMRKTGLQKTRNNFSNSSLANRVQDTFYATGGHCLLSKSKFLALRGFSPAFEPFYWEDSDICYRAWKRGWRVLFDPRCQVIHCHKTGSISTSYASNKIKIIQTRNRIIFFWKNISSISLWFNHVLGMLLRFCTSWLSGDKIFYISFFKALEKMNTIISERNYEKRFWIRKDKELFKIGKE